MERYENNPVWVELLVVISWWIWEIARAVATVALVGLIVLWARWPDRIAEIYRYALDVFLW